MTRFTNRRASYATINTDALQDPRLSLQAKGLLALMLSFPNEWEYHMTHLQTLSKDGREAHRSALKELLALGYVTRETVRAVTGKWDGLSYAVTDTPEPQGNGESDEIVTSTANGFSDGGKPPTTYTYRKKHTKAAKNAASDGKDAVVTLQLDTEESTPPSRQNPLKEKQGNVALALKLLEVWNANRGSLPEAGLTQTRIKTLSGLYKAQGEDVLTLIRDATREVAQDDFWKQRRYGLDNLLAGGKYVQKAESYRARPGYRPPTSADPGAPESEPETLPDDNPFFTE